MSEDVKQAVSALPRAKVDPEMYLAWLVSDRPMINRLSDLDEPSEVIDDLLHVRFLYWQVALRVDVPAKRWAWS